MKISRVSIRAKNTGGSSTILALPLSREDEGIDVVWTGAIGIVLTAPNSSSKDSSSSSLVSGSSSSALDCSLEETCFLEEKCSSDFSRSPLDSSSWSNSDATSVVTIGTIGTNFPFLSKQGFLTFLGELWF